MIRCGNADLDCFLEELKNEISLVYGPAASGKTTLVLMFAVETAKKGKVVFLDTEGGFSAERVKQMKCDKMENILVLRAFSFDEQSEKVKKMREMAEKVSLVIVDTLSMHYRMELKKDHYRANKRLAYQLDVLKKISEKIPVIITSQVSTDPETGEFKVVGGNMVYKYGDKVISLEKEPERKVCLVKPCEKSCCFEICDPGLKICGLE